MHTYYVNKTQLCITIHFGFSYTGIRLFDKIKIFGHTFYIIFERHFFLFKHHLAYKNN